MTEASEQRLKKFIDIYSQLNKDNLAELEAIYHQEVVFEDPAHRMVGWDALHRYFKQLYTRINSCDFVINSWLTDGSQAFVQWTMTFSHRDLNGGLPRTLEGCSRLEFKDDLIILHRDYFDLGEMIYEGVPLLGRVIRFIKTRVGK